MRGQVKTVRVMTYNVHHCLGGDGRFDAGRVVQVIDKGGADIIALQDLENATEKQTLTNLGRALGMNSYSGSPDSPLGFLSHLTLQGIQEYPLAGGGVCLRGDTCIGGKRLHLFNVRLGSTDRGRQIASLLGPELLGSRSVSCPTLVLGDFSDLWWGAGNLNLALSLEKVGRPLWSATYPARFPLAARDRIYLRGGLRVLDCRVLRHRLARQSSTHLPFLVTVQVVDPRTHLKVEKLPRNRMETAPG